MHNMLRLFNNSYYKSALVTKGYSMRGKAKIDLIFTAQK